MNGETSLRQNYDTVLGRIASSCVRAQRPPGSVSLLAVSKTFPAHKVLELARLGQRAFGENYLQEALEKISACRAERPDSGLEWHFIGPIQSNKTRPIAESFHWVHSIEREKTARRLAEQRPAGLPPLNVCIQANVSGEASKSGCAPEAALPLARLVATLPGLKLRGVMAIPEPTGDAAILAAQFGAAQQVFESLERAGLPVDTLSMGMSADLDAAIAHGTTMVRIGTALFGARAAATAGSARPASGP